MKSTKVIYSPKKRTISLLLALAMLMFVNISFSQTGLGIKTVVIDPGHGGKDPGAVGGKDVYEKDVVLNVGLELGSLIKKEFPNIKVLYTRSTDEFIGLAERAAVANKAGADLFISLHCNAAASKTAQGAESWVLGLHKSAASLEVAKKENNAILMEDGHENTYEDFNPNDPDAYIALAMRQNAFLDQSLIFADHIQKNFVGDLKRFDRGVKQAGFVVLYRATMPSVLVELGFLSHPEELKFLSSKDGQSKLAKELFDSFKAYKLHTDKADGLVEDPEKGAPKEIVKKDTTSKKEVKSTLEEVSGIVFKIQIATSTLNLPTKPENFKGMIDVEMIPSGKWYKYFVGNYTTYDEALTRQTEVREKGYDTAFMVAYEDGKKVDVKYANDKLKQKKK
jgi:N-acetylmuramoyl-L-alanine amidase